TAVSAVAAAQETPTERSAAADVIRRMNELERSLALPQLVARLTARDARRDAVVARARDLMDRELLAMADDITRHPEVGHKEERSVKILTDYLRAHAFDVEAGVAGLKAAFVDRHRAVSRGLRELLHEHRCRALHLRGRARASAAGVGRSGCAAGSDRAVQPHRRLAQERTARSAHSGHHHRRREGAERRSR